MTSGRIIHSFRERREIELLLHEIARERDEFARETLAQDLAARGEAVVPVLLRHLGTTNPLLRGAIGLVAAFLPREIIVPPLRQIAANPGRGDQERMTALMILERYLEEPVEESLYAELRDPQAVLEQSLREVVEHQDDIPEIVHDYVTQLQEEPVDVAHAVLTLAPRFPAEKMVPLLTLLAQDVRHDVAEPALRMLSRLRVPHALRALATLADLLPTPLDGVARRGARKLRMSGVAAVNTDAGHIRWRALVSPPDIYGGQTFWLAREGDGLTELLGIVSNMDLGLQFTFHLPDIPSDFVPARTGNARLVTIEVPEELGEGVFLFLDAPLEYVRGWLRRRFQQNFEAEYQLPVVLREHILRFWEETAVHGVADSPAPVPLASSPNPVRLFEHAAMMTWYVEIPDNVVQERRWLRAGLNQQTLAAALSNLDTGMFSESFWKQVAHRLRCMAEWFLVAGEEALAREAQSAAQSLEFWPRADNPYAQILLARGLSVTFSRLQEARERWEK